MSAFSDKLKKTFSKKDLPDKTSTGNKLRKRSTRIIGIVIILLIIAGIIVVPRAIKAAAAAKSGNQTQRTSVARKGEISTTISGSGAVTPSDRKEFLSKVDTTVTALYFKEGDSVKAGDLLMELDDTDVKAAVQDSNNSLLQGQIDYENNASDYSSLTITAPFDGIIKNLSAVVGNDKGKNESLANLIDTSKLKAQLTFTGTGIGEIKAGKQVTVYCQELMDTLSGTVTYVSSRPYSTSSGGELYNVEVEIVNPGSLQEGMNVSAEASTSAGIVSSTGSSILSYSNKTTLKSAAGGTLTGVNARENEYVKKGEVLFKLQNKTVVQSQTVADSKIKNLQEKLSQAQEKLDSCKIYAPFDGTIVKQNLKVGDSVKVGGTLLAVANEKQMQFDVAVDELDIEKAKVGQQAAVTLDALSSTARKPLNAMVSKIAAEGTSSNGVTTYPVTITIDPTDNLKSGMYATAEIYITHKTDVLTVPLQAITRVGGKTYVMVKSDKTTIEQLKKEGKYIDLFSSANTSAQAGSNNANGNSNRNNNSNSNRNSNGNNNSGSNKNSGSNNNGTQSQSGQSSQSARNSFSSTSNLSKYKEYYSDAVPTEVQVGLNDASNIEITSGLKEGDIVILPPAATGSTQSTTTTNNQRNNGFGANFGGGMTGGMPAGGFQGGGPRN